MKAPFRLRKRLTAAPADGLLFPREDMAGLVALCAATATARLPIVYRLAGGYLLALHAPTTGVFPGTIRLRRLGPNLFLPVDAELVPALLPDEATVLGRERGLVFLPGGRVLGFVPACPVPPRALLQAGRLERFRWEPFPSPPHLAARIDSVTLELPNDAPEVVLEAGGTDVGIEDPLADASEQPSRAADGVTLGLGRALMGLGRLLGLRGLSQVGARWVASVLNRVPRLGASLLGRQEAALRALLREFHEGNLERALRRAVPLGDENQRIKNRPLASGSLPNQAPHYSLADLLQGRRTGSGPLWLSSADVFAELQEAYRRAAAEATRRGDYRRAAFIYGKLLRNYRAAADVLAEGGLFHDAAIIYLKKVIDVPAAARAFERAGEIDEALELYRTRKDHLAAGDLLRRVGEAEAALAEFLLAADNLVSTQGHLAAGELLLEHVGYPDLARTYFERGWAQRPGGSSIGCALRLVRLHADLAEQAALIALLDEAEPFFARPGNDGPAEKFFNLVAEEAQCPNLTALRDDLLDRALLGLAGKLRQRAQVEERPGTVVSQFLGGKPVWAPPLVKDAEYAFKATLQTRPLPRTAALVCSGNKLVTAVGYAPEIGAVLVGCADGTMECLHADTGSFVSLPSGRGPVIALATDTRAQLIVALWRGEEQIWRDSYLKEGAGYDLRQRQVLGDVHTAWLVPRIVCRGHDFLVGSWTDGSFELLRGPLLLAEGNVLSLPEAVLALLAVPGMVAEPPLLVLENRRVTYQDGKSPFCASLGWMPCCPPGSSLVVPPLAWYPRSPTELELAGLDPEGKLFFSLVQIGSEELQVATNSSADSGYRALTILRPGVLAAVASGHVDWLRLGGCTRPFLCSRTPFAMTQPVACFHYRGAEELMVIGADGAVIRLAVPV